MVYDLPFEKPLAELQQRIIRLNRRGGPLRRDEQIQLQRVEQELQKRTQEIYQQLTAWQTVLVARHKDRPHSTDYLPLICDDFFELHGDRLFGDNHTIVGGPASFGEMTVMFICQEKGRGMKEQGFRNAGQAHPEGYRKAYRMMKHAEKFHMPIICLIDTPGASIAMEDEEHGQGAAIAFNLHLMARLRVPIIAMVIGEGGSGGALALGVTDRLLMQQHSYYTVASPESAATILWRDAKFAPEAAEAMQITAHQLKENKLIDDIVPEPVGGAHHNPQEAAILLKDALLLHLQSLCALSLEELLARRYQKWRGIGAFEQIKNTSDT